MKRYAVVSALTVLIILALSNAAFAQGATSFAMVGITRGQTLQINLVAWPPTPIFPPTPCMAELGFQDSNGKQLGTTKIVTLNFGQSASLTLNGDTVAKGFGQRVEVQPVVTPEGTFPPTPCFASAEVIDNLLGIPTVGVPGTVAWPPNPVFGMLSATAFQTVRLNVVAYPPTPCIGELSFADKDGNPVGATKDVNLSPGEATFLDLPGSALWPPSPIFNLLGQRAEVHPIITLAVGAPTACIASVEVYLNFTGQTSVYYPPAPITPASVVSENMTPHHLGWLRRELV